MVCFIFIVIIYHVRFIRTVKSVCECYIFLVFCFVVVGSILFGFCLVDFLCECFFFCVSLKQLCAVLSVFLFSGMGKGEIHL